MLDGELTFQLGDELWSPRPRASWPSLPAACAHTRQPQRRAGALPARLHAGRLRALLRPLAAEAAGVEPPARALAPDPEVTMVGRADRRARRPRRGDAAPGRAGRGSTCSLRGGEQRRPGRADGQRRLGGRAGARRFTITTSTRRSTSSRASSPSSSATSSLTRRAGRARVRRPRGAPHVRQPRAKPRRACCSSARPPASSATSSGWRHGRPAWSRRPRPSSRGRRW